MTENKNNKVYKPIDPTTLIHTTTDYDKFKRLPGNRPLIPGHVMQLVNSMRDHDLLVPVIVNDQLQIIDGQHRIEARRVLGYPVPYIKASGMTLSDVQKINSTSKTWTHDDYPRSYIEQGNQHYATYQEFRNAYGLPHEVSILFLAGRGPKATRRDFIRGEFRITDLDGARRLAALLQTEVRPIWPVGWKDSAFVRALYIANSRLGFEMDRFISALPAQRHLLQVYRSIDQYLLMIENIYNAIPGKRKVAIRFGQSIDTRSHAGMSDATRKSRLEKTTPIVRDLDAGRDREVKILSLLADGVARDLDTIRDETGIDDGDALAKKCSYLVAKNRIVRVAARTYAIPAQT